MKKNGKEIAWKSIVVKCSGETNTYELDEKEKLKNSFDRNKKRARLLKKYKETIKLQAENNLKVNFPLDKNDSCSYHPSNINFFNYIKHDKICLSIQISQLKEVYGSQNTNDDDILSANIDESMSVFDDYNFFGI